MTEYGYFLSCEQFTPDELIAQARRAQQAGLTRLAISDHFHPWNDAQGNSASVWSMIDALNVHAYADTGHCAKDVPKCAGLTDGGAFQGSATGHRCSLTRGVFHVAVDSVRTPAVPATPRTGRLDDGALVTLNGRNSHSHRPHHALDGDRSKTWRSSGGRAR